jgi:hypothetical protein
MYRLMIVIPLLISSAGCVRSMPLISHAHVGHAMTAWHDTPGKQGLFEVAEKETVHALEELELARQSIAEPCVAQAHVQNIVHAMNPDIQPDGNGMGYGALPALTKARQHLQFAAETADASVNMRQSVSEFEGHASVAQDALSIALASARRAATAHPSDLAEHLPSIERSLVRAYKGKDLDNDGYIGNLVDEAGLLQLRERLSSLVANEVNPPYKPIGEGYLLGLVREPDGRWVYRFNKGRSAGSGYQW